MVLVLLHLYLPKESVLYTYRTYKDYFLEELLIEAEGINLEAMRKRNSKKKEPVRFVGNMV